MAPTLRPHYFAESAKGDDVEHEQAIEYESPEVVDYGDLIELTAAGTDGDCLDSDFPAGTSRGKLTFSTC